MSSMGPMAQATTFLTRHGLATMTSLNPKQATTPPTEVLPQVTRTFTQCRSFKATWKGTPFKTVTKAGGTTGCKPNPFTPLPFFKGPPVATCSQPASGEQATTWTAVIRHNKNVGVKYHLFLI